MTHAYNNLEMNRYLSYNYRFEMINEYNNLNLISCMFPTLFPFRMCVPEIANKVVKISL